MPSARPGYQSDFLTPVQSFYEVTRGKPYLLDAEGRRHAGLTPETWRLEIVPDDPPWQPTLARSCRKEDQTALTLGDLETLFRERPIRSIKTLQCLMDSPRNGLCSNGFWEGVALRDVIARVGRLKDVRRVFYTGYFEDPKHRFASSLSLSDVLETPPDHTPVFLALRLNGLPLPIERGGPVRMLVPEGYGFKSIKWLNRIVLTNDYRANDTYAERQNNDPDSPMKTLARLDIHAPKFYRKNEPILLRGVAVVGISGLERVEYWLRTDAGTHGILGPDDPAWATAQWKTATLPNRPPRRWAEGLPGGRFPEGVDHLDPVSDRPRVWPLPFSWAAWEVQLDGLTAGAYEFRVRTVDRNGFAQPEPRPNPQAGIADVSCLTFLVD
jgi:DMSO/TMAO reductase YedYZ molybdopterin-dependent catalytic subunit